MDKAVVKVLACTVTTLITNSSKLRMAVDIQSLHTFLPNGVIMPCDLISWLR